MTAKLGQVFESQGSHRLPWLTFLLATVSAALYALAGPAPEALLFDRAAIGSGEVWRLVTGHFVHADAAHLWWNIAALVPLGLLLELKAGCRGWAYAGLVLAGAFTVDAWLWFYEPEIAVYCGLSGLLNGLYGALAVLLWRQSGQILFLAAVLGDLTKIGLEVAAGGALLPTSTWASVPGAHLAGLAAGLVIAMIRSPMPRTAPALVMADRAG